MSLEVLTPRGDYALVVGRIAKLNAETKLRVCAAPLFDDDERVCETAGEDGCFTIKVRRSEIIQVTVQRHEKKLYAADFLLDGNIIESTKVVLSTGKLRLPRRASPSNVCDIDLKESAPQGLHIILSLVLVLLFAIELLGSPSRKSRVEDRRNRWLYRAAAPDALSSRRRNNYHALLNN